MKHVLPIVEGDGDREAVPLLARRILHELHGRFDIQFLPAQKRGEWPRVKRDFERFYLSARLEQAPILWVLDFDCEQCFDPSAERAWLQDKVAQFDPTGRVEVVFMIKEFESIFLWDEEKLRLCFPELPTDVTMPVDPEAVRDAKGWISHALPKGRAYKPMADQARLSAKVDLFRLRKLSESFRRFESALMSLVTWDDTRPAQLTAQS